VPGCRDYLEWFRNRLEAKVGIKRWRRHYNEERPHMSLGDLTPAEFKGQIKSHSGWLGESPKLRGSGFFGPNRK
jgi:hypothetical protein